MKPDVVVDVGNTRMKWGRCVSAGVGEMASLPPEDPASWQRQMELWDVHASEHWAVAGVHPGRRDNLTRWLEAQGQRVTLIDSFKHLPLTIGLDHPEQIGIDRLLNAVAARSRLEARQPAVVVDAGSAITVDWLDEAGIFRGGAIMPGLGLMAHALHDYTALLPIVHVGDSPPPAPGTTTEAAIRAGISCAAAGGVCRLIAQFSLQAHRAPAIFLAGGDARILRDALPGHAQVWQDITLEGLRLAAERLP